MPNILIIGSSNTDMVVKTHRFPQPGETILGGEFYMFAGGKGANQAVAAARLGGHVALLACIGEDMFGRQALAGFETEGIDTTWIRRYPQVASGVALITVNAAGENEIVVASGANACLMPDDIPVPAIEQADWLLMQLEVPLSAVGHAARLAGQSGKPVILNPAPALELPQDLYPALFLLTPNETEASMLSGVDVSDLDSAIEAADRLLARGVQHVVVTMGAQGALWVWGDGWHLVPAQPVAAVDTTAAGDVFNGALAVALAEGDTMLDALVFASRAAAISVTRMGAQASAPYRHEVL